MPSGNVPYANITFVAPGHEVVTFVDHTYTGYWAVMPRSVPSIACQGNGNITIFFHKELVIGGGLGIRSMGRFVEIDALHGPIFETSVKCSICGIERKGCGDGGKYKCS